jgi:hypothetical protein
MRNLNHSPTSKALSFCELKPKVESANKKTSIFFMGITLLSIHKSITFSNVLKQKNPIK